ncbi:Putative peptide transport permease protein [Polaromonas vacuolata]|uniref:Peptide transport permease protein n=1 Tax=Polaromonas vacuolata TaxID=37448 RepID=A0A6H2HDS5_9BURK|nr:ABC transporter permease [Polaromonas vacuolata]QJC57943.1 Putative peptide transport permease protein [Polaromonas vacuolata]
MQKLKPSTLVLPPPLLAESNAANDENEANFSNRQSFLKRLKRFLVAYPPLVLAGMGWLVLVLFVAVFANWLAPYPYTQLDLTARLQAPVFFGGSAAHWLGTDELGRDLLSRLFVSVRISLLVAFLGTILSATIGITLGFLAAHFRAWVEQLVLLLVDFQASMPFMVIALAVLAFLGNTLPLFIALMGFYGWERAARITRGLTIAANEQGYAAAAHEIGASPLRVYALHVLPNIASTLIVSVTLTFPELILLEAGLSFLGLGVQLPMTSLGNMVGSGREYLQSAPWILLAPSAVIVLTTFSVSLVGDWLRDRLDPTLR